MSIEFETAPVHARRGWPGPGPIDLSIHDRPHESSTMEWWYVNSHVTTNAGRPFSMFAAFFRVDVGADDDAQPTYTHFLTWALVDPANGAYHPRTLLDPRAPHIAIAELDKGYGPKDDRIRRALREVLDKGQIPLPDRLLSREAIVATDTLALDLDGNVLRKLDDGVYEASLGGDGPAACRLRFTLGKPIVRHGDDGIVRGLDGEQMFYYFSPRCRVEGDVFAEGAWHAVAGDGWYDHEFGEREGGGSHADAKVAWNWVAAQLDNGCEISAYTLVDKIDRAKSHGRWAIVVDAAGEPTAYTDFSFEPYGSWTSTKSFNEYPIGYRLDVARAGISLDIKAPFPDQEVMTLVSAPAFWEGLVDVAGEFAGRAVTGRGFVERSGASVVDTTDEFLSSVGRETRRAIDVLLPERPTAEDALRLIGGPGRAYFLDGVDVDQYRRTVLEPIREIVLRGGKAWRSYGALACVDLVGGNSEPYRHWLALPELLHVGSLIIDDVQDRSAVRRGGPSCHLMYGEPLAINGGCVSYYLALIPLALSGLPDSVRARVYEAYFEAMRAAHAGQALDIDSLAGIMDEVVESGDGVLLERRVLAVHRLKSAVPPGALARMAAMIGGGTDAQCEGLGSLFEAYGLAFQIVDDVLNLRGFEENRKNRGEDITEGKVTAPVAKAMTLLPLNERRALWALVSSRPGDAETISAAIDIIERCGALDACEAQARTLVEDAWRALDPLVPDSQFKIRLRAFGWFVLDRHY
jgi:geranylgeranyl pyrophosphate synthase/predicted secreted hydrolase